MIYVRLWIGAWGALTGLAAVVGAALGGPALPLALGVITAMIVFPFVLGRHTDLDPEGPRPCTRAVLGPALTAALRAGAAAGALTAAAQVLGAVLVPLAGVATLTSPWFLRALGTRVGRRPRASSGPAGTPIEVTAGALRAAVETLDDAALCRAWRCSFVALLTVSTPADLQEVVAVRQTYLDELERRHPDGVRAWLDDGGRAAGDPSAYLQQAPPGDRDPAPRDRPGSSDDAGP